MSKKRVKVQAGDVFAVDLVDGTWGLGQVLATDYIGISCILFARRAASVEELRGSVGEAMQEPIGVLVTTDGEISSGVWPVLANRPSEYPTLRLPRTRGDGSYTVGVLPAFIEAYHGLRPWDEYDSPATPQWPNWNKKILLPHLPVPATARYKVAGATAPARPTPPTPPPVTEGPALVTIQLVYSGTGMPSTELVHRRQEMERRLEAADAGEVEGTESGAGVMEIYLRTDDVRRAVPLVEKIAEETGWKDDMLIETAPIEEEDDDDES